MHVLVGDEALTRQIVKREPITAEERHRRKDELPLNAVEKLYGELKLAVRAHRRRSIHTKPIVPAMQCCQNCSDVLVGVVRVAPTARRSPLPRRRCIGAAGSASACPPVHTAEILGAHLTVEGSVLED